MEHGRNLGKIAFHLRLLFDQGSEGNNLVHRHAKLFCAGGVFIVEHVAEAQEQPRNDGFCGLIGIDFIGVREQVPFQQVIARLRRVLFNGHQE